MRFIAKVFLIISVILTYLTLLVIVTLKFQFTDANFWINSFRGGNVYQSLEENIKDSVQKAFESEGSSPKEALDVSQVFTKSTIQDIVEKNTKNILGYVNGTDPSVIVYFPLDKLPADIRTSLQINSSDISLDYLLTTFGSGSSPIGGEFFTVIKNFNGYLNPALIITVISLLLTLFFAYKVETPGKRLLTICLSFTLSGALGLIIVFAGTSWVSAAKQGLLTEGEPIQKVLASILPPVTAEIFHLWSVISVVTILLGVLSLLFVRGKPTPVFPNISGKTITTPKTKK